MIKFSMFYFVAQAASQASDGFAEAVQALQDALSAGSLNPVLAVVAGVAVVGMLVLKALGKQIPLVDPIVRGALELTKKLTAKKADPAKSPGVKAVADVEKLGDSEDK